MYSLQILHPDRGVGPPIHDAAERVVQELRDRGLYYDEASDIVAKLGPGQSIVLDHPNPTLREEGWTVRVTNHEP